MHRGCQDCNKATQPPAPELHTCTAKHSQLLTRTSEAQASDLALPATLSSAAQHDALHLVPACALQQEPVPVAVHTAHTRLVLKYGSTAAPLFHVSARHVRLCGAFQGPHTAVSWTLGLRRHPACAPASPRRSSTAPSASPSASARCGQASACSAAAVTAASAALPAGAKQRSVRWQAGAPPGRTPSRPHSLRLAEPADASSRPSVARTFCFCAPPGSTGGRRCICLARRARSCSTGLLHCPCQSTTHRGH